MALSTDIVLDDVAFNTASSSMKALKIRTEQLKTRLENMYNSLVGAMQTPAGEEVKIVSKDVLIEPIENLLLVIEHISETLTEIIGTGYYKDVFIKFETLNNIKFN